MTGDVGGMKDRKLILVCLFSLSLSKKLLAYIDFSNPYSEKRTEKLIIYILPSVNYRNSTNPTDIK